MDPVVILGRESVTVGPGQEGRLPVRIRNQGRRVESYRVEVVGAPSAFAQVEPSVVSVLPGREVALDVIFRPPGGSATPTGTLPFAVRATSEVDSSSSAATEARLELVGVAGMQAWAPETTRWGRWSAHFNIEFDNQGNAATRLALTAHDPTGTVRLQLDPEDVDLVPGGRATAELTAKTRSPFLRGSPVARNLQVTSQTFAFGVPRPEPGGPPPQDDPNYRTFQLTFQQKPILPKLAIPLMLLAVVAVIAFAVWKLRGDERPQLELAAPLTPSGLQATSGGPNAILLAWRPVANAEGYEVVRTSVDGVANEQTLAEALPADQHTYEVPDLEVDTEYCFVLSALGPKESPPTAEECATTSSPTRLQRPTGVNAVHQTGSEYRVTWDYPPRPRGVEFVIFVDGNAASGPSPIRSVVIPIESEDVARTVSVVVQAVLDDDKSPLSDEFPLEVPAISPETTAPAPSTSAGAAPTTQAPATTQGSVVEPPPTTATETTSTPSTTSETTPLVVDELQNPPPTLVAMLRALQPQPAGSTLEAQLADVAATYELPVERLRTFSNRDTLAEPIAGETPLDFADAPAAQRFVYVRPRNEANAQLLCQKDPANCIVVRVVGAAAQSEGTTIAILPEGSDITTISSLDTLLDERRETLGTTSINVLDGREYDLSGGPVIYARGFDSEASAIEFCETTGLSEDQCLVQPLQPAD
jgi:hypothetical protein